MRFYRCTETDEILTEEELKAEFKMLKAEEPESYNCTFYQFVNNCLSKNGFLELVEAKDYLKCFAEKKSKTMINIYLPNTPSQFVCEPEIFEAKKIKMSCGGGIGGINWNEYIKSNSFPNFIEYGFVKVTNHKNEEIMLNTKNMVKIVDVKIVKVINKSQNPYHSGIKTFYYEIPCDANVKLVNDYGQTEEQNGVSLVGVVDGIII